MATEIELPDGTILEAPDGADPSSVAKAYLAKKAPQASQQQPSTLDGYLSEAKRGLGLAARMGVNSVAALPMMAADSGVAWRTLGENLLASIRGEQPYSDLLKGRYVLPSQMLNQGMEQLGMPKPQGFSEKALVDVVGPAILSSKMPVPEVSNPVPSNFVAPSQRVLKSANDLGLVVPPATAKPGSIPASIAEGAAGKLSTGQLASAMNQPRINQLAAQEVGLTGEGGITRQALEAIRSEAGQAHEALRSYQGPIVSDTEFRVARAAATKSFEKVAEKFPALAQKDLIDVAQSLDQPRFSTDEAVSAISLLRDRADTAYRAGSSNLGRAYRQLSNAFESLVERRLEQSGQGDLVSSFRDARQLIAKTYTIENALKGENVNAAALANALDRGKYLSGTLRTLGEFAQNFPKAARVAPATESLPMYSPLDFLGAGSSLTAGAVSGDPRALVPAAYLIARPWLRNYLLSDAGQNLLINGASPSALGAGANASVPVANALRQ